MNDNIMVLGFPDYKPQAQNLANTLGVEWDEVIVHHFPDGESKVKLPARLPEHVIMCRSLNQPNDKLIELLLASRTARDIGCAKLSLVTPYLCYMRQDAAFSPGEGISQSIIGKWLGDLFDQVVTVDPHLHRADNLASVIPSAKTSCLSATELMGKYIANRLDKPLLVGPDSESKQWVSQVASTQNLDFLIGNKIRLGDRSVEVELPKYDFSHRDVVLIDDIASTGQTLLAATVILNTGGAKSVHCLVTHALFSGNAINNLNTAGVEQVWSTDSINHPSNEISLAPLLAEAIDL